MSVLVLATDRTAGAIVGRLLEAGDSVRVVSPRRDAQGWRSLGTHVATGDADDPDLIERAAQGARTIVIPTDDVSIVQAGLEGARAAAVQRVIVCARRSRPELVELLRSAGLDYVLLIGRRRRVLRSRRSSDRLLASAVDAADDLAGSPRLELDLRRGGSWASLGLRQGLVL